MWPKNKKKRQHNNNKKSSIKCRQPSEPQLGPHLRCNQPWPALKEVLLSRLQQCAACRRRRWRRRSKRGRWGWRRTQAQTRRYSKTTTTTTVRHDDQEKLLLLLLPVSLHMREYMCVCVCCCACVCVSTPHLEYGTWGRRLHLAWEDFCALFVSFVLWFTVCAFVCVCPFPLSPFYRKCCIGSLWGLPTKGPVRVLFVVVAAALFHLCFLSDFFLGFQFVRRFVAPVCSAPCCMPHASCPMPNDKWFFLLKTSLIFKLFVWLWFFPLEYSNMFFRYFFECFLFKFSSTHRYALNIITLLIR